MMKRTRSRSENEAQSLESCASLTDGVDALQVEDITSPVRTTRVRRTRSGSQIAPSVPVIDVTVASAGASLSRSVIIPNLAVSGLIVEHQKSGQLIAPQNAVFVYDPKDSRSVKSVQKKIANFRKEFPHNPFYEFTAKGTTDMLPTAVGGASVGIKGATLAKCCERAGGDRKRVKSSD